MDEIGPEQSKARSVHPFEAHANELAREATKQDFKGASGVWASAIFLVVSLLSGVVGGILSGPWIAFVWGVIALMWICLFWYFRHRWEAARQIYDIQQNKIIELHQEIEALKALVGGLRAEILEIKAPKLNVLCPQAGFTVGGVQGGIAFFAAFWLVIENPGSSNTTLRGWSLRTSLTEDTLYPYTESVVLSNGEIPLTATETRIDLVSGVSPGISGGSHLEGCALFLVPSHFLAKRDREGVKMILSFRDVFGELYEIEHIEVKPESESY